MTEALWSLKTAEYTPKHTLAHPRAHESSAAPPWEPKILWEDGSSFPGRFVFLYPYFFYLIILEYNFNFTWMLWLIYAIYMLPGASTTLDHPFVSAADRDAVVECTYEDLLKSSALQVGSFDCPQCFKRYRWKKSLLRHMRLECGQEPSHFCPHCDWPFKHKHHLISHITLTHRKKVK